MTQSLTNQTRKALALANEAARAFNHTYIGTEHILLGLIDQGSGNVPGVLTMLGVDADNVRREVEKLVQRGPVPVALQTLPLTPRSKQALELAGAEAQSVNEKCVTPEHLLLGLAREETGVACQVLRNLGVNPNELRAEVLKIRLAQMQIVERAVRPVRGSTTRKRKMREELLAHLSAIYDEELLQLGNPAAALNAAAQRFGDPRELGQELEAALPYSERLSYFIEKSFLRWFAWRAPESVAKYSLRQGIATFALLAIVFATLSAGMVLRYGWIEDVQKLVRVLTSILLITPPAQFVVTLSSLKMRDAMWGVFGSRKSFVKTIAYGIPIAAAVIASFVGFAWAVEGDFAKVMQSSPILCLMAGVMSAIGFLLVARFTGPTTIRDTQWALLDTEG